MSALIRRSTKDTDGAPVRGGGFAIPVHGVDADGFALDPHNEIAARDEYLRKVEFVLRMGGSFEQIQAIPRPWSAS